MPNPPVPGSIQSKVLIMRLMSVSLALGILIFVGVQFFMFRSATGPASSGAAMMTNVAAGMWLCGLVAGFVLFQRLVSPDVLGRRVSGMDDDAALNAIFPSVQTACLIRWALLEGPALFAAVILFLNQMNVRGHPILLVDLVLVLLSATLILLTAPSEQTMREWVRAARRSSPPRLR